MLQQTQQYRRSNLALRARTVRDLQKVWPALDARRLDATFSEWLTMAALIVGRDRVQATNLAAEYLTAFPATRIVPPRVLDPSRFEAAMRISSVVAVKSSMIAGRDLPSAMEAAFVLSAGAASRLVLDAGRETVMGTAAADPECQGWQRITSGGCDFCQLLASRGEVYNEASVDFPSHDHCMCSAEPVYS